MTGLQPPRFMLNVYSQYPDDNSHKLVQVQAFGTAAQEHASDRHCLLQWTNAKLGSGTDACEVIQMTQLTGGVGGFGYYRPLSQKQNPGYRSKNAFWDLGVFSRQQRNRILELAARVDYKKSSRVNNCMTWLRDLLMAMVKEGMIDSKIFEIVDIGVPLKKRIPE